MMRTVRAESSTALEEASESVAVCRASPTEEKTTRKSKEFQGHLSHLLKTDSVLKWATQSHVKNSEGGRSDLGRDCSLLTFIYPGFDCGSPENLLSAREALITEVFF